MGIGCFAIFSIPFYVIGIGILGQGLWEARRSARAASWPAASGTIKSIEVREDRNNEGATYSVHVQYAYTVEGVSYEGSRLAFGYGGSNNRRVHEEIGDKLRDAKSVAVHYDPSKPSESCLSFGVHRTIQFTLVFAITWLMFLLGFTACVLLWDHSDSVLLENLSIH